MTSVTSFTPDIFATFSIISEKTVNTFGNNKNNLEASDIYNQIIRHQFVIRNSTDIAPLFPKTVEEIGSSFHLVKNNVITCLQKIISISPEARNFENTILEYDRTLAYFLSKQKQILCLNIDINKR